MKKSDLKKIIKEELVNELTYHQFKTDDSSPNYRKINTSINEMNSLMFKIERIAGQAARLKTEDGISNDRLWKSTRGKITRIAERLLKVAKKVRDIGS